MVPFKNAHESHEHSLETLEVLYGYDSFLDSLETIADFGCGHGLDSQWWANLETRDDPPEPREYRVYSVDINLKHFNKEAKSLKNIHTFEYDFDDGTVILPTPVDFIWCHDAFQYVTNPLNTLKMWNKQLNANGMLCIILPQLTHYAYNRWQAHSYNKVFFNYNIVNLIYMLAVNGFDCNDAYFLKEENNAWLSAAVYKSNIEPMDPKTTTWYQLAELNLINESMISCLNKYGYIKQEEIVTAWLDKDFCFPKE
jgi:SAM-dependent methyltransferase